MVDGWPQLFLLSSVNVLISLLLLLHTGMLTPMTPAALAGLPPDQLLRYKIQSELDHRNRPLTEEEINSIIPSDGYAYNGDTNKTETSRRNRRKRRNDEE